MKLKKIEIPVSTRSANRPLLTVSKTGRFSLAPAMREKTGYATGDRLNLFQDEEAPRNWFLAYSKDEGAVMAEKTTDKYTAVFFQNAQLAATMREVFKAESSMTFSIGASTELGGG